MDSYTMTDKAILAELGGRIKTLRLRKNLTQQQLAEATALSLNSIKALEKGHAKLSTLVAVARELGVLDSLIGSIPDIPVSPLQLAKQQGKVRQRASGARKTGSGETKEW